MNEGPRNLLKLALTECLPILQPLAGQFTATHRIWRKAETSGWRGEYEERPDIGKVFKAASQHIEDAAAPFGESFFTHHPEYVGMIGFSGCHGRWGKNTRSHIVSSALRYLWWRYNTFDLGEAEVETIVREFSDFIDQPTVRLRYEAQLLNFSMPAESLPLPNGMRIRRLSEDEASQLHGGPIHLLGFARPRTMRVQEFVLEGHLDEPKDLGENHPAGKMMGQRAKE